MSGTAAKAGGLRVLLVGNYEPDQQQSMQRYANWLRQSLQARGCTVALMHPKPRFSRLAAGPLRKPALVKYLGYLDKYLIFPRQLRAAARRFDLVHICDHSNSMYLNATGTTPTLITCHDLLAVRSALGEFSATRTGWSGRRLQAWILNGLRGGRNVICVSTKTAVDLKRLAGNAGAHLTVIFNPLNWPYQPQSAFPEALRARLGFSEGKQYFLHVGGNQWYKNRPAVVSIFRELAARDEFKTSCLVMAGKPLPNALRSQIAQSGVADRILPITGTTNEELQALYSLAQALIFPSLEEGFGWPIAEAQACGCPVAVTNRPPMTEVAGEAAIFFDPEDPAGAAEAIRKGLARGEELRQAGFRNVTRFDEASIVEQYLAFYGEVLNRKAV